MRVLGLLKADATSESGAPPSPELMEKMGKFMEAITKAGVLVATAGLQPSGKGARVRVADGQVTVTDGPFTDRGRSFRECRRDVTHAVNRPDPLSPNPDEEGIRRCDS